MSNQVNVLGADYTEKSFLGDSAVKKAAKPGVFAAKEMAPPANNKTISNQKVREMSGNCPMNHDSTLKHKEIPS